MVRFIVVLIFAILAFCSLVLAEPATFRPTGQSDISFSIAVSGARESSSSDRVFFQIQAPDAIQWVGLGQGKGMKGSNIFVLHNSASSNNVTLSPRSGVGHKQPQYNPDAQVSLLNGSGNRNGILTANVQCDNCLQWEGGSLDTSSSSSPWIFAYKEGQPLNSDNVRENIQFHDMFGGFSVDLTKAKSTSQNPFRDYNPPRQNSAAINTASKGSGGGNAMLIAHGFMMAIAFVLLFPLFALLVPLPIPISVAKIHAPLQVFALALAIAGAGLGIKLWVSGGARKTAHPIIGIVVIALLVLFQPAMGLLQHMHFRRTGGKSPFAYAHRWLGRVLIILGIINGGLGLRLAGIGSPGTPKGAMIAYSVIAGIVGLTYLAVHGFVAMKGGREKPESPERTEGLGGPSAS
ncbi:CBD9-like protein [Aspergillus campestris IBT 28561]|uniref:CBD9-like protein n=1 Tax=Aspergillus campestris (strain IBT 28561) TaxID=1392248 RepID=A0A2I1CRB6_ASPC2|nr:CBD9-like protein [Aspergillus campestris IBT 28561]PKY00176.1 CBD9-like protein [Aspergillus campestris IBT 28561]